MGSSFTLPVLVLLVAFSCCGSAPHNIADSIEAANDPETDLVADLCGHTCAEIVSRRPGRANCRLTWGQGCPKDPPPRSSVAPFKQFTKSSTLWEMCPRSCPDVNDHLHEGPEEEQDQRPGELEWMADVQQLNLEWCRQSSNHAIRVSKEERAAGKLTEASFQQALKSAQRCGVIKLQKAVSTRALKRISKEIRKHLDKHDGGANSPLVHGLRGANDEGEVGRRWEFEFPFRAPCTLIDVVLHSPALVGSTYFECVRPSPCCA